MKEYDDIDRLGDELFEEDHKWDVLSHKGKLYYREVLFNGFTVINPNYKVFLIRRYGQ